MDSCQNTDLAGRKQLHECLSANVWREERWREEEKRRDAANGAFAEGGGLRARGK